MNIIEQYGHGLEIPKDELTAIERDRLLNEGKEVDRIMCCIDTGETSRPFNNSPRNGRGYGIEDQVL